jgi:hypothetical protein
MREIAPSEPSFGSGTATNRNDGRSSENTTGKNWPSRRALLQELVEHARRDKVTLVFGARDAERCNAAVIAEMIRE